MKILLLITAAAGTTLLGAAPPPRMMDGPPGAGGYPPCSRTVTDRCIQLYERGVATPRNLAENERLGPGRGRHRFARGPMMGPGYGGMRGRRVAVLAPRDYPPCGPDGEGCVAAPPPAAMPAPPPPPPRVYRARAVRAHYDRVLVRTGERG